MPYVSVEVDVDVSLDDYEVDDLIEELESRGYTCAKNGSVSDLGTAMNNIDFDRIEHLSICGQKATARTELFSMVQEVIGYDLEH